MLQLLHNLISLLLQFLHLLCQLMLLHPLCQACRYPLFQHLLLLYPSMMLPSPSAAAAESQSLWSLLLFSSLPLPLQQWWYPLCLHLHLLPLHFSLLLAYNAHMVLHCYSHFHLQLHHLHLLLLLPFQTMFQLFLEKRSEMLFWCLFRLVYLLGTCLWYSDHNDLKRLLGTDNFVWSCHALFPTKKHILMSFTIILVFFHHFLISLFSGCLVGQSIHWYGL